MGRLSIKILEVLVGFEMDRKMQRLLNPTHLEIQIRKKVITVNRDLRGL
jgi:hypothetical protein